MEIKVPETIQKIVFLMDLKALGADISTELEKIDVESAKKAIRACRNSQLPLIEERLAQVAWIIAYNKSGRKESFQEFREKTLTPEGILLYSECFELAREKLEENLSREGLLKFFS